VFHFITIGAMAHANGVIVLIILQTPGSIVMIQKLHS